MFLEQRQHRPSPSLWIAYLSVVVDSDEARDAAHARMRDALRAASGGALFGSGGGNSDDAPRLLWSAWYMQDCASVTAQPDAPNVCVVDDADGSPHFEHACTSARAAVDRLRAWFGADVLPPPASDADAEAEGDAAAESVASALFPPLPDPDADTAAAAPPSSSPRPSLSDDAFGDGALLREASLLLGTPPALPP